MQSFASDYLQGCHPRILEKLQETNLDKHPGYGQDDYCKSAKEKICLACQTPDAQVSFLVGGTQTNETVIAALLRTWQGVLAAETGHIAVHEAGAVEYTGHKVLPLRQKEGKISASDVEQYICDYQNDENHEHMVEPGMVYISHPTEYGTLYSKAELEELHSVCHKHHIPLFLDGARLGYGLMAKGTDVSLPVIARNTEVFYIGGTKVGALFGEAVVIPNPGTVNHFFTTIKQHGALLAKGWLLGVQFDTLFTDNLYFNISKNAIDRAGELVSSLEDKEYRFYLKTPTNQQFVIIENDKLALLEQKVQVGFWARYDDSHTVVRFATSWATTKEDVDALRKLL
ncbi:MAG: aminotransferase class I/II-fold pyridoxal phosphate-dependent enzyme [Sphaerochaetaceae bacterium]